MELSWRSRCSLSPRSLQRISRTISRRFLNRLCPKSTSSASMGKYWAPASSLGLCAILEARCAGDAGSRRAISREGRALSGAACTLCLAREARQDPSCREGEAEEVLGAAAPRAAELHLDCCSEPSGTPRGPPSGGALCAPASVLPAPEMASAGSLPVGAVRGLCWPQSPAAVGLVPALLAGRLEAGLPAGLVGLLGLSGSPSLARLCKESMRMRRLSCRAWASWLCSVSFRICRQSTPVHSHL
mmetsp:Transcript_76386/g.224052  ORF Transcript_76386/g.224052 Transcript_76386/m.224052 type:complete len:244 (+) Transcript_76386:30-761(+)